MGDPRVSSNLATPYSMRRCKCLADTLFCIFRYTVHYLNYCYMHASHTFQNLISQSLPDHTNFSFSTLFSVILFSLTHCSFFHTNTYITLPGTQKENFRSYTKVRKLSQYQKQFKNTSIKIKFFETKINPAFKVSSNLIDPRACILKITG